MGNSCCTKRIRGNSGGEQRDQKSLEIDLKKNTNKKKISSYTEDSGKKSLFGRKNCDSGISEKDLEESKSESQSISDPSEDEKSPVDQEDKRRYVSYRSEHRDGLEYEIIVPGTLPKLKQNQVVTVLDSYKHLIERGAEHVDGFVEVIVSGVKFMMMISTHAIYLLDINDFSIVSRRCILDDLKYFYLTEDKKKAMFVFNDEKKNFIFFSDNMINLLKSIQQIFFETFSEYLPWIIVEDLGKLEKTKKKNKMVNNEIRNDENLAVFKAIVEYGEIGEDRILAETCSDTWDNAETVLNIILTSEAIYTLDSNYGFKNRIPLKNIENISFSRVKKLLTIYSKSGIFEYSLPLEIGNEIKNAAHIIGNKSCLIKTVM